MKEKNAPVALLNVDLCCMVYSYLEPLYILKAELINRHWRNAATSHWDRMAQDPDIRLLTFKKRRDIKTKKACNHA
jgi:hypothetical protein